MKAKKIIEQEEELQFEDNNSELPPSDIVAFNELRSCADLLRLHISKQLDIQPEFQRDIVWSNADQTRFIDSLTKQLPIPSMCISLDYKTDKRLVIDGLQRINSIINFLSKKEWKLSELDDIDYRISGKTVEVIMNTAKEVYERVQNVMIPVTVIRCDLKKQQHNDYLFTIFHRLNSGGLKLNNQEIRNCIFNGAFNKLLRELARLPITSRIFGTKTRFANEEMILRFFAFYDRLDKYNGKLSRFLNNYMFENQNISNEKLTIKKELYLHTISFISEKIIEKTSNISLGKTILEGLFYGIAKNLNKLNSVEQQKIKILFDKFRLLPEYSIQNLKEGLSAKDKVIHRLESSKKCFSK